MMIVECINLDKHIEIARGVVTLHHLRNLLEFLHDEVEVFRILEVQSDIGTCFIANFFGVDNEL